MMQKKYYTKEHEWFELNDDIATFGISDYAQQALGDIVFIELPEIGDTFNAGDSIATLESVKAASDIYMPLNGDIVAINSHLEESPEIVNDSPEKDGWFVKIKFQEGADFSHFTDQETYLNTLANDE